VVEVAGGAAVAAEVETEGDEDVGVVEGLADEVEGEEAGIEEEVLVAGVVEVDTVRTGEAVDMADHPVVVDTAGTAEVVVDMVDPLEVVDTVEAGVVTVVDTAGHLEVVDMVVTKVVVDTVEGVDMAEHLEEDMGAIEGVEVDTAAEERMEVDLVTAKTATDPIKLISLNILYSRH